jgi:hypothetical protein
MAQMRAPQVQQKLTGVENVSVERSHFCNEPLVFYFYISRELALYIAKTISMG